jgi:hypothetical protein
MPVRNARTLFAIAARDFYRILLRRSFPARPCRCEPLEPRQLLSTFYIAPHGNDHASGLSISAAWKSIDRVNHQTFHPGDVILFQSRHSYHGSISLNSSDSGTPTNPITISSFGPGRATIRSGMNAGLNVNGVSGLVIHRINFRGGGMHNNHTSGLSFFDGTPNRVMDGIAISNIAVSGYGQYNIKMESWPASAHYQNVRIVHASLNSTLEGGLWISGAANNVHKNIYVGYVNSFNHPGSGTDSKVTGNGIFVADVDGAVIEHCLAFDNGQNGRAPVGIWAAGSNRVTIQYCESYDNHTKSNTDGGGFDFDWDTTNSTMQYNYSHDNDGPGYLICADNHKSDGNVIRYNITQNDARKNGHGAILLYGNAKNLKVYNNTVYMSPTGNGSSAAFNAFHTGNTSMANVDVRNNIFYTTGGVSVVDVDSAFANNRSNSLVANNYYSGKGRFQIKWNGRNFDSLPDFRNSTGQEKVNGMAVGYQGNPRLKDAGKAPTLHNTKKLTSLWEYQLRPDSILVNQGQNPRTTLSAVSTDFFGSVLPRHGKYDIGANELS